MAKETLLDRVSTSIRAEESTHDRAVAPASAGRSVEMTIAAVSGAMIGPPAARQCAVEPTGVETISPSAANVLTCSPLMKSRISMRRENASRDMTMSLTAVHRRIFLHLRPFGRRTSAWIIMRSTGSGGWSRSESSVTGEFLRVDLGEEAELSQVHAEERDAGAGEPARGGEDGAVAAEDEREGGLDALMLDALEEVARADARAAPQVLRGHGQRFPSARFVRVQQDDHMGQFHGCALQDSKEKRLGDRRRFADLNLPISQFPNLSVCNPRARLRPIFPRIAFAHASFAGSLSSSGSKGAVFSAPSSLLRRTSTRFSASRRIS